MIYLMNTSILPNFGSYTYEPISQKNVVQQLTTRRWTSAVGHDSTAEVVTILTGVPVKMNRITIELKIGDSAIVFKLNSRPPEGAILSREELEKIGFSWGIITKTKGGEGAQNERI